MNVTDEMVAKAARAQRAQFETTNDAVQAWDAVARPWPEFLREVRAGLEAVASDLCK